MLAGGTQTRGPLKSKNKIFKMFFEMKAEYYYVVQEEEAELVQYSDNMILHKTIRTRVSKTLYQELQLHSS